MAKTKSFKIGDWVTWKTPSDATSRTKVGQVLEVVEPGSAPQLGGGEGAPRSEESYLVEVTKPRKRSYWPLTAELAKATEPRTPAVVKPLVDKRLAKRRRK